MGHSRQGSVSDRDVIRYTSCWVDCFNTCILKVRVRDGVIVAVEPDDTINRGVPRDDACLSAQAIDRGMVQSRPCPKGYAQAKMIYAPDRVTYPMKRVGARGEARFKRISWDEALDTLAEKLVETRRDYGPYSIMHQPHTSRGYCSFPLAPWFGAGIAVWGAHSFQGWEEPEAWVLGKDGISRPLIQDETNIFKSRLIVLWGLNPIVTQSCGWAYNLLRAKERGIPMICIEPRYTETAELLADQWIPIRPTTDVAMMIAMANVWFKEDLCDREFIEQRVEPEGLRRWKEYVLGGSDGVDKSPSWAESICGVPAETISEFARLYARSKPVNLNVSLSIGRQFYGENPTRASMYLQALTGNTCIPGGTAAAETAFGLGQPLFPKPMVDWQRAPGEYQAPALLALWKWPMAIDLRDKLDSGEMSKEAYNNAIGSIPQNPSPNIQMVIIEGCNQPITLPDVNQGIRALKKAGFVAVFSQFADAGTARYADLLLPQISDTFEGGFRTVMRTIPGRGKETAGDRFKGGRNLTNFFLYCQKCVEPVGEVRPHDWVWTQVAMRLGIADKYNPRMAGISYEEWETALVEIHREAYEKWKQGPEVAHLDPPDWEQFQGKPVFRREMGDPNHAFKDAIRKGKPLFPGTASGKIEFYSPLLAKGPRYLASTEIRTVSASGGDKYYGGGNLPPMAEMTKGGWDTFFSEDARKYPLLMSTPHSLYRSHGFLDNNPWLAGDCYRHAVWVSAVDGKARGIKDDDLVRVYNDIGEMIVRAYVTSRVVPGSVFLGHTFLYRPGAEASASMPDGIDTGGAVNVLVHNKDLPLTIVDVFHCKGLVEIEKWQAEE